MRLLRMAAAALAGLGALCGCSHPVHTVRAAGGPAPAGGTPEAARGSLQVVWTYPLAEGTGVTCGDLEGTGAPQVVVRARRSVHVLDGSGKRLREFDLDARLGRIFLAGKPGQPIIVGIGTWSQGVTAFDKDGQRLWDGGYESRDDAVDWACPIDLGPDGVGAALGYNGDSGVRVLNPDGRPRWRFKEGMGNTWSVAAARLAAGAPQSLIVTETSIWIFDPSGHRAGEAGKDSDAGAVYAADLDGDGVDELLGVGTTQISGNYLSAYRADGKLLWRRQALDPAAHLYGPLTAARLLGGRGRQVAVGFTDGNIVLFDSGGEPLTVCKAGDQMTAMATLPGVAGKPDRLIAVTDKAVVGLGWSAARTVAVPRRFIAPPAQPEPPLITAILRNNQAAVESLLSKHADPQTLDSEGSPALVVAAANGNLSAIQALVKAGAKLETPSREGHTPLIAAIEKNQAAAVDALLAAGASPNTRGEAGIPPIGATAMFGQVGIARALLDRGADPNMTDSVLGQTPLLWAISE